MKYLKINYDVINPTFEEIKLPEKTGAWLDACYKAIGCESIEIVRTCIRGMVLIVDEESKLKDGWQNRINRVATQLYASSFDCIAGDAILAREQGANIVPLTEEDINRLRIFFPV